MLSSYQDMYTKAYGIKFPMIHDPTVIYYILEPSKF
jgi:inosine-uridine nucleoside N-ribohydrolase